MSKELELKYGCNPNQKPARIFSPASELPLRVLNGNPGYINFLDALNGWQLARELKAATGLPAAASFKHVSPAGAAIGLPLPLDLQKSCFVDDLPLSPLAAAYARARGADRVSSYGDFIALSDDCDRATAALIAREVSDGVIAPGYEPEALSILKGKRQGRYNIVQIDAGYRPPPVERKEVFGVVFEQGRNDIVIDGSLLRNFPTRKKELPETARRDLLVALVTLKYTQSNSVCYAADGQAIGVGAGQQSRIHCTRLAGDKADLWQLRRHPRALELPFRPDISRPERDNLIDLYLSDGFEDLLGGGAWDRVFTRRPQPLSAAEKGDWLAAVDGVSLASDAFFPFGDNIERARRSGVRYIAQTGGSIRDDHVIEACDRLGITMALTGVRLFHH
ncbi:MAG: phosphoribosylaminoimidazolecarboxamide formyltransferase [Gracilibacteraceae bacterium]|jgi:phosphoribosylaminoimidazolecarboxamide formyltransferase/IMP cyclohydrolase/phosphoribosylaminoimidazolecarboxamide formyltransferase|nr:phosphoribosylaminoimidazolecarboxamide formyltransferase [Gracilibacteraceae bacterium]